MISGLQAIGGGLQRGYVIHRERRRCRSCESRSSLSFSSCSDEAVAIEVIRGLERQERG